MIKWRFSADGNAIRTTQEGHQGGAIAVRDARGCLVHGPYLEIPAGLLEARFTLLPGAQGAVTIEVTSNSGTRSWSARLVDLATEPLSICVALPEDVSGAEIRLHCDGGADFTVTGLEIDLEQAPPAWPPARDRNVGTESRKSFPTKLDTGFLDRYLSGRPVLEVGYRGYYDEVLPIVPQAIGVDIGYPGYDGIKLPFADESFSAVYSSHCLEHIPDPITAIRDWFRILPIGGFLIIAVPHQWLYERRANLPSGFNPDHHRFYTPQSLLTEINEALPINSYRIRHFIENDAEFDYGILPGAPPYGSFEVEIVLEKIRRPDWNLDDHTVRAYSASEFATSGVLRNPWALEIDLGTTGCVAWGPYTRLGAGQYEAVFYISGETAADIDAVSFDVARDLIPIGAASLAMRTRHGDDQPSSVAIPFDCDDNGGVLEFRVYVQEPRANGRITFIGAHIRYRR